MNDNDKYTPQGVEFYDAAIRRTMRYVMVGELRGWLVWKHPDGQWVTVRKATKDDIDKLMKVGADICIEEGVYDDTSDPEFARAATKANVKLERELTAETKRRKAAEKVIAFIRPRSVMVTTQDYPEAEKLHKDWQELVPAEEKEPT